MHDTATMASPWRVPTIGEMLAREAFGRHCFEAAQKQAEHVRKPLAGFRDVLDAAAKVDPEKTVLVLPDLDHLTKENTAPFRALLEAME